MNLPHLTCSICSSLKDGEDNFFNSSLPRAAYKLILVHDMTRNGSRKKEVKQCPECKTYYFYRTDYEFLAGGSEDEEYLTRLSDEEAQGYLCQ